MSWSERPDKGIVALFAIEEGIPPVSAMMNDIPGTAHQDIIAVSAHGIIVAGTSLYLIIIVASMQRVVPPVTAMKSCPAPP